MEVFSPEARVALKLNNAGTTDDDTNDNGTTKSSTPAPSTESITINKGPTPEQQRERYQQLVDGELVLPDTDGVFLAAVNGQASMPGWVDGVIEYVFGENATGDGSIKGLDPSDAVKKSARRCKVTQIMDKGLIEDWTRFQLC